MSFLEGVQMMKWSRNGIALLSACALSLSAVPAARAGVIQHVFVIAMENHDGTQIYGNTTDAPYINNTLIPNYAHATNFNDELALARQRAALRLDGGGHQRLLRSHLHHRQRSVEHQQHEQHRPPGDADQERHQRRHLDEPTRRG